MSGYLIDTSVFIAAEAGRAVGGAPAGEARISVATLTELMVGVNTAKPQVRELRQDTLTQARRFIALAFDELVAERLAELLSTRGARRTIKLIDAIIAATALVHGLSVWTQDDDFETLAEAMPRLQVVRA